MELSKHLSNLVTVEAVPDENFSHTDFLFAKEAKRLIYNRIIDLANTYKRQ